MDLLLPSHFITYMGIAHIILLILAGIYVFKSSISNLSKFILIVFAFLVPVIGSILALTLSLLRRKVLT